MCRSAPEHAFEVLLCETEKHVCRSAPEQGWCTAHLKSKKTRSKLVFFRLSVFVCMFVGFFWHITSTFDKTCFLLRMLAISLICAYTNHLFFLSVVVHHRYLFGLLGESGRNFSWEVLLSSTHHRHCRHHLHHHNHHCRHY